MKEACNFFAKDTVKESYHSEYLRAWRYNAPCLVYYVSMLRVNNSGFKLSARVYSEPIKKSKMKLFPLVKNLFEFPVITISFLKEESKRLLLLKWLKQKINAKLLKLLMQ